MENKNVDENGLILMLGIINEKLNDILKMLKELDRKTDDLIKSLE